MGGCRGSGGVGEWGRAGVVNGDWWIGEWRLEIVKALYVF